MRVLALLLLAGCAFAQTSVINGWGSGGGGATTPATNLPLCGNGSANGTRTCTAVDYQSPLVLNVRDYGAKGDGSTDDTTAINNALVASTGGTLSFPDGTYLHQSLTLSSNVTLSLSPHATLKLKAGATTNQISIAVQGVTIRGGTLDGNSANNPSAGSGVFIGSGLSDITVDGVTFLNDQQANILTLGASGPATSRVIVRHCTFNGANQNALYFNWDTTDSEISDNVFLAGAQNAIWVGNSSTGIRVTNNLISGYARMGIEIWGGSSSATVTGNTIRNTGSGTNGFGISIDSSPSSVVANNNVNLTSPAASNIGIEIVQSNNVSATGNVIQNAGVGMSIDQASGVVLSGNRVAAFTGGAGIQLVASATNAVTSGNTITGNRVTISQTTGNAAGIWLQASATGAVVSDNALVGNVIDGQNTSSGTGISLELDTGTMNRNQVAANVLHNLQNGVNHNNDALTSKVLNQYDTVGTAEAGSTANGKGARFDAGVISLDDANNKLIQGGAGTRVLLPGGAVELGSDSGPRFSSSGGQGYLVPGSDATNAIAVKNSSVGDSFTFNTVGNSAGPVAGTFSQLSTCNSALEGHRASVKDSTTATIGATIAGGGTNHVPAYCNATNWVVF